MQLLPLVTAHHLRCRKKWRVIGSVVGQHHELIQLTQNIGELASIPSGEYSNIGGDKIWYLLEGLDVTFGAQLQLVRTNVLVVETDSTTTKAMAEVVHSVASRKYPAAVRPDFTCFVADGDVRNWLRQCFD